MTSFTSIEENAVDLSRLTLCAAAAGISDGRFTSTELTQAYFARIRRYDASVRAWVWIDEARALARAREADRARRNGKVTGPLLGVPIAVKDVIYTEGIPTGMGSPIFDDFVPSHSAHCLDNLLAAGAYVQGKTVTAEFATRHPGPTTNPWNFEYTPGGSSSGSAAAVAADFTAGAIGTQTVGSIIRPAAYCGIVGYKPSFGLVSRFGVHQVSQTLDQVGVLTRTLDDAALLASSIIGADSRDRATLPGFSEDLTVMDKYLDPPRLAAVRSPSWQLADENQRARFEADCTALAMHGARLEHAELPAHFSDAVQVIRTIQAVEAAANFQSIMSRDAGRTSTDFRNLFDRGMRISGVDYLAALNARAALSGDLDALFSSFDAIVTPPATGEPPQTNASTGNADFCAIWTLCGVPCVSIPTGLGPQGLPMGLQIIGKYLDDGSLLRTSKWCSEHLPFPFHAKL